jgi:predicted nucleic acid-binding protein
MVRNELTHARSPQVVRAFLESAPAWLQVQSPSVSRAIPSLDPGEEQAINLAESIRADAILIDELKGRKAARLAGLRVIGTVGILELAASKDLIDLRQIAGKLLQTAFHIDPSILQAAIDRDAKRRR